MHFEFIDDEHSRAKVPGGWIIKSYTDVLVRLHSDQTPVAGYEWRTSICFMPDADHVWQIDKEDHEEN